MIKNSDASFSYLKDKGIMDQPLSLILTNKEGKERLEGDN